MKIEIVVSCAGSSFAYRKGDKVSSENTDIERLKDLVRAGHAIDISSDKGEIVERKVKSGIETR